MMKNILKKYRIAGMILMINLILLLINPSLGIKSLEKTSNNLKELLAIMLVTPIMGFKKTKQFSGRLQINTNS